MTDTMSDDMKDMKEIYKTSSKDLLYWYLENTVDSRVPRALTGKVNVKKMGPVMCVQVDESLKSVFHKLAVEGFTGAPVVDGSSYVGFISILDLVKFTYNLFWGDKVEEWVNFWEKEQKFCNSLVSDILLKPDEFMRDPFPPVMRDFSCFHAFETMAKTGLHRLCVLDKTTKRITGIYTQSMIISELRQYKDLMGDSLRKLQVKEFLNEVGNPVISIKENEKAITAFNTMHERNVTGLAVVNENGVLTNTITAKDLRGVGTSGEYFFRLFKPVTEYKQLAVEAFPKLAPSTHFNPKSVPTTGLFVRPSDTLDRVIELMEDGNIHRVFVCSEESVAKDAPVPTHVIAQRDVLSVVLKRLTGT